MLSIIQLFILAGILYFAFIGAGMLKVISEDTKKKEELNDALEKFGTLIMEQKKKKVVRFTAKSDEDDA